MTDNKVTTQRNECGSLRPNPYRFPKLIIRAQETRLRLCTELSGLHRCELCLIGFSMLAELKEHNRMHVAQWEIGNMDLNISCNLQPTVCHKPISGYLNRSKAPHHQEPVNLKMILLMKVDGASSEFKIKPAIPFSTHVNELIKKIHFKYVILIVSKLSNPTFEITEIYEIQSPYKFDQDESAKKLPPMDAYKASDEIVEFVHNHFLLEQQCGALNRWIFLFTPKCIQNMQLLEQKNYLENFKLLLHLEECYEKEKLKQMNAKNVNVTWVTQNKQNFLKVQKNKKHNFCGLKANKTSVTINSAKSKKVTHGVVYAIYRKSILISIGRHVSDENILIEKIRHNLPIRENVSRKKLVIEENEKFDIQFIQNRYTYQAQHYALEKFGQHDLVQFLYALPTNKQDALKNIADIEFIDESIKDNAQQRQVVEMILKRSSYPAPYIIFGPPGTGKTTTIIETVLQIYKRDNKTRILLSAANNSACNYLAEKLMNSVENLSILRLFASMAKPDPSIIEVSNLSYILQSDDVSFAQLSKYRIIVATTTNCAKLSRRTIQVGYFDYVFIDECGSAMETACLLPMIAAGTSHQNLAAQVVLAGDPFQLGPVVFSKQAKERGLGLSLLERLMQRELYSRNKTTGQYNRRYITKLCKNFRSHPAIIRIPNQLFYRNEIQLCGRLELINRFENHSFLLKKNFPIIIRSVCGNMKMSTNSHSVSNAEEVCAVMDYVSVLTDYHKVKPTDIGIISPYLKQISAIKVACQCSKMDGIEIGTVEYFQGREKPVIIISTVRSNTKSMGFLDEPKRFNVAITRAQSLLIIVGNTVTLKQSDYWGELIRFVEKNTNAVKMKKFDKTMQLLNLLNLNKL